jgi:16S rRNA processing protein RimM
MPTFTSSPVAVAYIAKTHGLHGEVVLNLLSDVEGRMEETDDFLLVEGEVVQREVQIESRRFFNGRYVVKFRGIDTLTDAEILRRKYLAVPEENLGTLPPDQYFIHDLIGMRVRLVNGEFVGHVRSVLKTGGVDLLEIGENGEILVPFAAEICIDINLKEKEITIQPPEGLLQVNAR